MTHLLTGGWLDSYNTKNQQTAVDKDYYKTALLVVKPSDYSVIAPKQEDVNKIFKIACVRGALYHDLSSANYQLMKGSLTDLEKTFSFGNENMKLRELKYDEKPPAEKVTKGGTFKLQPSKIFLEVANGLKKLASETGLTMESITTSFLTQMKEKSKKIFDKSFNDFSGYLTENQKKVLEGAFNLAGKITDHNVIFRGNQAAPGENTFVGQLDLRTTSPNDDINIYRIHALTNGHKTLHAKYLIKKGEMVFISNDLRWAGHCHIETIDAKERGPACNSIKINPSLENQMCAEQILNNKPLTSCDFVSSPIYVE